SLIAIHGDPRRRMLRIAARERREEEEPARRERLPDALHELQPLARPEQMVDVRAVDDVRRPPWGRPEVAADELGRSNPQLLRPPSGSLDRRGGGVDTADFRVFRECDGVPAVAAADVEQPGPFGPQPVPAEVV